MLPVSEGFGMTSSNDDIRRATETLRAVGREGHPDFEQDPVGALAQVARDFATVLQFHGIETAPTKSVIVNVRDEDIGEDGRPTEDALRRMCAGTYDESAEPPLVKGGQGRELRESRGRAWVFGILAAVVALGVAWALGGWGAFTLGCAAIGCGALFSLATQ